MFTPKTKCELVALVREELIALDEIDVSLICLIYSTILPELTLMV